MPGAYILVVGKQRVSARTIVPQTAIATSIFWQLVIARIDNHLTLEMPLLPMPLILQPYQLIPPRPLPVRTLPACVLSKHRSCLTYIDTYLASRTNSLSVKVLGTGDLLSIITSTLSASNTTSFYTTLELFVTASFPSRSLLCTSEPCPALWLTDQNPATDQSPTSIVHDRSNDDICLHYFSDLSSWSVRAV